MRCRPDYSYDWRSRLDRAFTQRIHLMPEHSRKASDSEFFFKVMGNTDNAYDIAITRNQVWCSCPDCDSRGNFCKHLMFVMIRVMGMPAEQVFEDTFHATDRLMTSCNDYIARMENALKLIEEHAEKRRKPIAEDDECPICYESFADTGSEATVWCKASCGKSVHASCFQKWSKSKRNVDCVYCRAKWAF